MVLPTTRHSSRCHLPHPEDGLFLAPPALAYEGLYLGLLLGVRGLSRVLPGLEGAGERGRRTGGHCVGAVVTTYQHLTATSHSAAHPSGAENVLEGERGNTE